MEYKIYYDPPRWHYKPNGEEPVFAATLGVKGEDGKFGQYMYLDPEAVDNEEFMQECHSALIEYLDMAYNNDN